jgi:hypothetical protein
VEALYFAMAEARNRRTELNFLNALKAKLKQDYDKLIAECETHLDSIPDGV